MNGNKDTTQNYILITPCKNEGENLPSLINSILSQTIKPIVWVILDDGSTDNTPFILNNIQNKYNWIKILRLNESPRDLGLHLSGIMMKGFDYAIDFCNQTKLKYDYLGNVDGDLILPPTFFENLIKEFERDSNLGVSSGGTDHLINGKKIRAHLSENEPSGGHMLIRRRCFEESGGIPLSYAMDSVLKVKARLNGWKTKRFEENVALERRDIAAAEGYWKGYVHIGEASYYLNLNPLHIAIRSIKYSIRKPFYCGVAFLVGYIGSIIRRKKQIDDDEVRHYFWNRWKEHL